MELKSEPKYDIVEVTDIDVAFPGDLQTYTLWDGRDSMARQGDVLTVAFGTGGEVNFNLQHAHWFAKRHRTIRVVAKEGQSATPTAGVQPPSTE